MIAGTVMVLFILGLFFEMLGSRPRSDAEWQNDTEHDTSTTQRAIEAHVPVTRV